MLKKHIAKLVNRYGWWRLIHLVLASTIITLAGVLLLELVVAVRVDADVFDAHHGINVVAADSLVEVLQPITTGPEQLANVSWSGLFRASTPLPDRPMADKTIERIKSQLTLQCIMEMNGEPVAYVNIKGAGLKKCKVGDTFRDLFTVLNINTSSVEITIVGHRVILSL